MAGLSAAEAASRLRRDGRNELPTARKRSGLRRFVGQLFHFFALMLWSASALALLAGLPQLTVAIAAVIVVNAVFAFIQQDRADRAAERLHALLPRRVTVRRAGAPTAVDAAEVVVGDLLLLEAGDRVPADAEVAAAHGLVVDTSLLTGESVPTTVEGGPVYAGTFVVEGDCEAHVVATGGSTRLAGIARLTTLSPPPLSPLTLELHRVVRTIARIAVGVGAVFFGLALLVGNGMADGFVLAIGVTVALVPEALLPTVTLSLAWGAEQMAKRAVLVRNLDAVETLGSTTFICTDKTGTLTRNEMTVMEAWTASGSARAQGAGYDPATAVTVVPSAGRVAIEALARAAVRCSTGYVHLVEGRWLPHGDPMEAAMDTFARRLGIDTPADRLGAGRVDRRFPFDPRRRRMSVVVGDEVVVKGAPDAVLALCEPTVGAAEVLDAYTAKGYRVIAVATRPWTDEPPATAAAAERELRLLGLLALEDPPRDDVAGAIRTCRRAGVRVAMVTGDHPATAAAIATEVGLRAGGEPVLVGDELPLDDAALGDLVDRDGVVVARVSPEDKLRIARVLRARGHVVAMTGDGVNDGPALHEADIGIAMGQSGTDVAREAADLVLLDDHFASIVAGVEQGRAAFLNVRRFLTYHLTDNVAELTPFAVWALSGGNIPLALGVMQVLALDIGTDTLTAVALGAEPPSPEVLARPPVRGRLLNHSVARRAFGVLGPTEALMAMAAFFASYVAAGWRPGQPFTEGHALETASGAAFMAVVLAQIMNAYACRSATRWPGALGWRTNRLLGPAVAMAFAISLTFLLVPPVARQLHHRAPSAGGLAVALAAPAVLLAVDAIEKRRRRSHTR